ncbi:MAG: hypothetical protein ACM3NV_00680 [Syntrophothermus sp.]
MSGLAAAVRQRSTGAAPTADRAAAGGHSRLGALPLLALTAALGVLLVALGNNAARNGGGNAQLLFWGGLVVIYTPIAARLLSEGASREERLALGVLLGLALYLVKVVYSPTGFTLHDELATWRQTYDLLETGHPLSANPLVTGYAGFPGLESISAAVTQLTGLRIFIAGTLVIGLARALLMVGLFLFIESATRSPRAAGIGLALYACNPSFLYFDSQFGYESLALTIAVAILLLAGTWSARRTPRGDPNAAATVVGMAILAATLAITHHMSSYAVAGFLLLWALIVAVTVRPRPSWLDGPALPGGLVAAAGALWFAFEASHVTTTELGSVFEEAAESVLHLVTGQSGSKQLFQAAGQTNGTLARALGVASVIPLLAIIPVGLWRCWRGSERDPLWRALSLVAVFFPLTLLLRLTEAGTETSQRASEFVYVGLAFLAGLLLGELRWPRKGTGGALLSGGIATVATVVFVGGFIIGESPATRQPGGFLVGGETRSITPQGLAAAKFAAEVLPPGSRVLVDRPNSTLVSSYGRLDRVSGSIEGVPVVRVFFSPIFDTVDRRIVSDDRIEYIVVDRRLSHEVPVGGYYFEGSEARANRYKRPIPVQSLRKFNHVRGLSRIFENRAIAIYDTRGLLNP